MRILDPQVQRHQFLYVYSNLPYCKLLYTLKIFLGIKFLENINLFENPALVNRKFRSLEAFRSHFLFNSAARHQNRHFSKDLFPDSHFETRTFK